MLIYISVVGSLEDYILFFLREGDLQQSEVKGYNTGREKTFLIQIFISSKVKMNTSSVQFISETQLEDSKFLELLCFIQSH